MGENDFEIKEEHIKSNETPKFTVKDKRFWVTKSGDQSEESTVEYQEKRRLPTYLEELQQKLEEKDRKLKEYVEEIRRENEEFRNRLTRNMEKKLEGEKGDIVKGFLTVLDNLERALDSGRPAENPEAFLEGVQIIRNQFLSQLNSIGVERLRRVGEPFNPETDEAIELITTSKKEEDNIVLEEIQAGYVMNGRLIRPAKVKVGKYVE